MQLTSEIPAIVICMTKNLHWQNLFQQGQKSPSVSSTSSQAGEALGLIRVYFHSRNPTLT